MWKTIFFVFFICFFLTSTNAQFTLEKKDFVNAPPDVVFTYLMDLRYFPDWIGGFVSFRYKDGIPGTKGARSTQVIQQQGMRFEFVHTILEIEENKRLVFSMESDQMDITIEYLFIPERGGTYVKQIQKIVPKSFLFRTMQGMVRRSYASNADENFIKFREIVENRSSK